VRKDGVDLNLLILPAVNHLSASMAGHSSNFDWSNLASVLDPGSRIPGDVVFKIVDQEDKVVASFAAHRFVLALHSDHFNNVFFGSGVHFKEKQEGSLVIKDTTKEAFEDFLGFNYEKKIDFGSNTLQELFEIFNLAERYQVEELKKVVSNFIKNFPLSMDNLVKAAATAKEYCHFEGVSGALYANCVDFTKAQFTDVDSLLTFVQENDDDVMVMKLLKDIKLPVEEICSNCKQKPCRNKSNILATDLITPGMRLQYHGGVWMASANKFCRVVSRTAMHVSISWEEPPSITRIADPFDIHIIDHSGRSLFEYACDK